jgi:hypothetical protein
MSMAKKKTKKTKKRAPRPHLFRLNVEYTFQVPTLEECLKHKDLNSISKNSNGEFTVSFGDQDIESDDLGKTFTATVDDSGELYLGDNLYSQELGYYVKILKQQEVPELNVESLEDPMLIVNNTLQVGCQSLSKKDAVKAAKFILTNFGDK